MYYRAWGKRVITWDYFGVIIWFLKWIFPSKRAEVPLRRERHFLRGMGKESLNRYHRNSTESVQTEGKAKEELEILSPRQGVLMLHIQHRTKWARIYCGGSKIGLCLPNSVVPGGEHSRITKLVRADCPWNTLSFYVSIFLFVCAFWTLALF